MPFDGPSRAHEPKDRVSRLLLRARERIEAGWIQRDFSDFYGHVCPLEAIWREGRPLNPIALLAVLRLRRAVGGPIIRWNDDPERTKEEVLAAFDRAAQRG